MKLDVCIMKQAVVLEFKNIKKIACEPEILRKVLTCQLREPEANGLILRQ